MLYRLVWRCDARICSLLVQNNLCKSAPLHSSTIVNKHVTTTKVFVCVVWNGVNDYVRQFRTERNEWGADGKHLSSDDQLSAILRGIHLDVLSP